MEPTLNLAEGLCRTIFTEVEDPYSPVYESQFSKPVLSTSAEL